MMRFSIMLLVLLLGIELCGQTDSIELAKLFDKKQSGEISKSEYSYTLKKWNAAIENDTYPDLPVNKYGQIQYSYIVEYKSLSKEQIFNRILEWFALTNGVFPGSLYENREDGKIISSNILDISNNTTGTYTYVFTILDGKALIEFIKIAYQRRNNGYYSGETWIPEKIMSYPIDDIFPVILKAPEKWAFYLQVINKLNDHLKNELDSLDDYILNYDSRYHF